MLKSFKNLFLMFVLITALVGLTSCPFKKGTIEITQEEFDSELELAQNQYMGQGLPVPEDASELKQEVLDRLIQKKILFSSAIDAGFVATDEDVENEIATIKQNFQSEEEFAMVLQQQGYTLESLKTEITEGLAINKLIDEEILADLVIEDKEALDFYNENPEYFEIGESVTASHILVNVDSTFTEEQKIEAKQKIEAIAKRIEDGEDFALVAMDASEGPSGPNGGDLGSFSRGQMVEPFESAAFALEIDEVSDIVETQFGYHIIKLFDKSESGMTPFEDVKPNIVDYLKQEKEVEIIDEYAESKKKKYEIIHPEI